MKIAIINNGLSSGGLRFEASLIRGLRHVRPDWKISYFTDISTFTEHTIKQELIDSGVLIDSYKSLAVELNIPSRTAPLQKGGHIPLSSFDVLIFTWPYDFCCPDVNIPILFIPHDFNFFYFFDSISFSKEQTESIRKNLLGFFKKATPVVSTNFIKSEVVKFFPEYAGKTNIIAVATMSNLFDISEDRKDEIIKKFALKPSYFLYPCSSVKPYKNLGILAVAIHYLKQQGIDAQIVYVGKDTDKLNGDATESGIREKFSDIKDSNVRGLGFVTDEELMALMRGAQAVVTSSLYEAANGPAIDAWNNAIPVAMSNLPFYTEHIAYSGVRATLFEPKNLLSVVDAFKYIMNNRQQVIADAVYSKEQIKKNTPLDSFATGYATLIERIANG